MSSHHSNAADDYIFHSCCALADMRLIIEGAVLIYEDEASTLLRLARVHDQDSAALAFDTIGSALYSLREQIRNQQTVVMKAIKRQGEEKT